MYMSIKRFSALVLALALMTGSYSAAAASSKARPVLAAQIVYVSPTGSDSNPGTSSAPFKTLDKAVSVIQAGDTLVMQPGIYYEQQLKIKQSGTATAPITVNAWGAVIDLMWRSAPGTKLMGSYIRLNGLQVRNSSGVCVQIQGSYVTVNRLRVFGCRSNGISASENYNVRILNSWISRTVLSNSSRAGGSGWDSAVKVRLSRSVVIMGNRVFHNYGEGIAVRGTNILIRGNTVYDNYSVNIYSNSERAVIDRNFVYCTANSGYERNGLPAGGIILAEEYFPGWGARVKYASITNNIVAYCRSGVRYSGADSQVIGGGLKYSTIAYNTLYGTVEAPLGIEYESAQAGNLIADNIIWQADNRLAYIENGTGLTFKHNLWKALPPPVARGVGDRIGSPGFAAGNPALVPGAFRPESSSLAAGAAVNLNILLDYFGAQRGPLFDIGAVQISLP